MVAVVIYVGVDPGGKWTGVITRHRSRLLYAATVTNQGDWMPTNAYLDEVRATVSAAVVAASPTTKGPGQRITVAIEGLNEPSPHLGIINVRGLIGAAAVYGTVLSTFDGVVIVPPGGNGSAPLGTYPSALVGSNERVGTGKMRHCRSAWDVSLTAEQQLRLEGVPRLAV